MNPRTTRIITAAAMVGLVAVTLFLAYEGLNGPGVAQIVGYQRTADERKLVVVVQTGLLTDVAEREVREDGASVHVTVHVRTHGNVPSVGIQLPVLVQLQDRLGDRQVLDQAGTSVRYLGIYQPPAGP